MYNSETSANGAITNLGMGTSEQRDVRYSDRLKCFRVHLHCICAVFQSGLDKTKRKGRVGIVQVA